MEIPTTPTLEGFMRWGHYVIPSSAVCQLCGRTLTNPVSITQRFGPVCIKKIRAAEEAYRENQEVASSNALIAPLLA